MRWGRARPRARIAPEYHYEHTFYLTSPILLQISQCKIKALTLAKVLEVDRSVSLTPMQCKLARVGANLSRAKLAELSGVSVATLADFEAGKRDSYDRTVRDIKTALEDLGATFLDPNQAGPGVRINEKK